MSVRSSVRALALPAAVALALTASAAPAHAHVGMTASTTTAGSSAVLTFSVPHGCDGSPTVRIAIQIPETITRVNPTRHPLYSVTVTKRTLDQPITDGHGNRVAEGAPMTIEQFVSRHADIGIPMNQDQSIMKLHRSTCGPGLAAQN